MSTIEWEIEKVRSAATACIRVAQDIISIYAEINRQIATYENSISTLKKNLSGISSTSQTHDSSNTSKRNAALLETNTLNIQSARLKTILTSACSLLMGELGQHLDNVRIGINSLIIKLDKPILTEEQISILTSITDEVDSACSKLGSVQFPNCKEMEKIFTTLNSIKLTNGQTRKF